MPYLAIVAVEPNIFTIDGGTITAQEAGLTYLEIRNIYDGGLVAEVYLSIEPKNLRIWGIPSAVRVGEWVDFIGLTSDCGATFNPSQTGWTSSNPEVFQITRGSEHEIYGHALSEGTAIIHADVPYYGADVYFTVTVKYIKPTTVSIVTGNGKKDITIYINDIFGVDTTVKPDNADCNILYMMDEWHSTNDNVSLLRNGYRAAVFQGKKVGTSKVYAMVDGVKSNEIDVTIADPTVKITELPTNGIAGQNTYILKDGTTHRLSAIVTPIELSGVTYKWSSRAENVATIDDSGIITTNNEGNTQITVEAYRGDKLLDKQSFTLIVVHIDSVFIDGVPSVNLTVGGEYDLTAVVYPMFRV